MGATICSLPASFVHPVRLDEVDGRSHTLVDVWLIQDTFGVLGAAGVRVVHVGHLARAFEVHALVDEDRWCVQGSGDVGRHIQLDGASSANGASNHSAPNDHVGHIDLRVDFCAIANDQRVIRSNHSSEGSVDSETSIEQQFSFEMGSASEQGSDFRSGQGVGVHLAGVARPRRPGNRPVLDPLAKGDREPSEIGRFGPGPGR